MLNGQEYILLYYKADEISHIVWQDGEYLYDISDYTIILR